MNLNETKSLLHKYRITPTKSLGQNFLIDELIQQKIIEEIDPCMEDIIIEIGPGAGVLSTRLSKRCSHLILIEIDKNFIAMLNEQFAEDSNTQIIHRDALVMDYGELVKQTRDNLKHIKNVKVVSNLPYYITTPIVSKLVRELPDCNKMVFTMQTEAADRIMSKHDCGEYGILSVIAQYLYDIDVFAEIPAICFYPQPNVESVAISMTPLPGKYLTSKEIRDFEKFIKAAFGQRRKTLANSLSGAYHLSGGKESVEEALVTVGLKKEARAQELSPDVFRAIYLHLIESSSI